MLRRGAVTCELSPQRPHRTACDQLATVRLPQGPLLPRLPWPVPPSPLLRPLSQPPLLPSPLQRGP
eukprot:1961644-Prymnesium_polylepis.1